VGDFAWWEESAIIYWQEGKLAYQWVVVYAWVSNQEVTYFYKLKVSHIKYKSPIKSISIQFIINLILIASISIILFIILRLFPIPINRALFSLFHWWSCRCLALIFVYYCKNNRNYNKRQNDDTNKDDTAKLLSTFFMIFFFFLKNFFCFLNVVFGFKDIVMNIINHFTLLLH